MSGQHAALPPSASEQWSSCTGWLHNQPVVKDPPARAAAEGTLAHSVWADLMLTGRMPGVGEPSNIDGWDVYVTKEMHDGAIRFRSLLGGAPCYVEHRIDPRIHQEVWGTVDYFSYDVSTQTLHVADYKYGFIEISPEENLQLTIYALGAWYALGVPVSRVKLSIFQPRQYGGRGLKTWETGTEWLTTMQNYLGSKATANAQGGEATPGEHCTFCPAKGVCKAFAEHASAIGVLLERDPRTLSASQVEYLFKHRSLIKGRLRDVETAMLNFAMRKMLPADSSFRLAERPGNRAWVDEQDAARLLAAKFGTKVFRLKTIKELEETSPAVAKEVERLTERPPGKPVVVSRKSSLPDYTPVSSFDNPIF